MVNVLFVSVRQSFHHDMSLPELEPWVASAWAISVAKAETCDRVVAVLEGEPVGAWRIRGAYPSEETYRVSTGDSRPRAALSLGDPLPILAAYRVNPSMRHGVAVVELGINVLTDER